MDKIIPVSELRAKLSEICKWVERKKKPVFLTKNGHGRFVLLDINSYEKLLVKASRSDEDSSPESHVTQDEKQAAARQRPVRQVQATSSPSTQASAPGGSTAKAEAARSGKSRPQDPDGLTDKLREEEERILKELGLF